VSAHRRPEPTWVREGPRNIRRCRCSFVDIQVCVQVVVDGMTCNFADPVRTHESRQTGDFFVFEVLNIWHVLPVEELRDQGSRSCGHHAELLCEREGGEVWVQRTQHTFEWRQS
jgi:hypothetical protein